MTIPEHWTETDHLLTREFTFANFVEAVEFVNNILPLAERAQHHPDIDIYGYKHVRVKLTTHDAGHTVTEKDTALAGEINHLLR